MVEKGASMEEIKRFTNKVLLRDEIGYLLWQLEEIENFYPCYKSMLKKE
jgi:hypothetical protein